MLFRTPVEQVITYKRYVYVDAPSKEEAHEAALQRGRTFTWEEQTFEYYAKTPVPVTSAPRVDIRV